MGLLRRLLSRPAPQGTEPLGAAGESWRHTLRRRLIVAAAVALCWALGVEARLVYLQVITHGKLVKRAERQQMQTIALAAKRGDIVDRRGRVLATSVDADTIFAVPSEIGDEREVVRKLCGAFGDCTNAERENLVDRLRKQRNFAYIRRQVTPDEAARIKALNLDGIAMLKESRRYYPKIELAAQLLGFVGLDNKGLSGLESAYDSQIRGKEGQVLVHTDARRQAFSRFEKQPTAGATIELTIDEFLQHTAERELRAGVIENRAVGGSIVIMNPHTGEILAMASEPTFNPNAYRTAVDARRRNRAVQDLYEPGSTFKVVTASAALEERVMPTDSLIETDGGQIRIGARVVRDTHDYGPLSLTDVMVHSSNVGAIKIGLRLGADRLSNYVERFGFGRPISPDFPSESPGIVWGRDALTESALASVSMGYQVAVTPLQMAAAVSAIANRGEFVEPRVVRAVYRGDRRIEVVPKVLRQAVSPATAGALTAIMEQVVERGTAVVVQIPGYTIAGKTGTANKLVNRRYTNDTYASFVGFLPSNAPALTILVVLDSPRGPNGHFGGPVAGPIFRRVGEAAIRYLGIGPTINAPPPVIIPRHDESGAVTAALPLPSPEVAAAPRPGTVPAVLGLSARDAVRTLVQAGLIPRLTGDGFVVSQHPAPGEPLVEGRDCRLTLTRSADPSVMSMAAP